MAVERSTEHDPTQPTSHLGVQTVRKRHAIRYIYKPTLRKRQKVNRTNIEDSIEN